jgi:biopolymer transport protein ExbD
MLVLLVIFIITAPLLTNAVKIDLPHVSSSPNVTEVDNIQLAINGNGEIFWNGEPVAAADLSARFTSEAQKEPAPALHLHADRDARYEIIAEVMSDAAKAGLVKIGFVTDPSGSVSTSIEASASHAN